MKNLPEEVRQAAPDLRIQWTLLGYGVIFFTILAHFAMPLTAALAMLFWTRVRHSRYLVIVGLVISILPLAVLVVPFRWLLSITGLPPQAPEHAVDQMFTMLSVGMGIAGFFLLVPIVLSVISGASRGCLRIKSLLPGSIIPGWFLVLASYLQVLIFLVFLVIINLIAGNALLIMAGILTVGVPVVYVVFTRRFIQPLSPQELPARLYAVRYTHLAMSAAAMLLFLVYLWTARVGENPLFGFSENALLKAWQLPEYVVNFLGRALFMTVLAVDQFMRVNITVWHDSVRFAQTPEAAEYGHVMDKLHETMRKD
jgi:hypothetical protein